MKIKKYISIIILIVGSLSAIGQESKISWLKENTTEFIDFKFIDETVKDKQFVFIGESSHGAKEFFIFRSEITQYLIKNHGFDVVAIESPFLATYFYNHLPNSRSDTLSHVQHVLFPIFCNKTTQSFVDTLDNWSVPLVGFDVQLGSNYQARNTTKFVYDKLVRIDSIVANEFLEINPLFFKDNVVRFSKKEVWYNYPCNAIKDNLTCEYWLKKYNHFEHVLTSHYDQLVAACNNDSLAAFATLRAVQTVQIDLLSTIHDDGLYIRDSIMAENIDFIISSLFPNKKIIFLAHNAHIAKNYHSVTGYFSGDHRTMVSFLDKSTVDNSVVIGLYGIQGETNFNKRSAKTMTAIEQDSTLEYHLKDIIEHQAYIDLEGYPNSKHEDQIYLCIWGIYPEKMDPKEQYDYLVFIKNLTPSTYLD